MVRSTCYKKAIIIATTGERKILRFLEKYAIFPAILLCIPISFLLVTFMLDTIKLILETPLPWFVNSYIITTACWLVVCFFIFEVYRYIEILTNKFMR